MPVVALRARLRTEEAAGAARRPAAQPARGAPARRSALLVRHAEALERACARYAQQARLVRRLEGLAERRAAEAATGVKRIRPARRNVVRALDL